MKSLILTASLFLGTLSINAQTTESVQVVERPIAGTPTNYLGNKAPLQSGRLIKLPFGTIHPRGWLRKYMELQRDGLNGQLGSISAWLDKNNNQWLSGSGSHGWEEVPYWLKGYASLAYMLDDENMLAETKYWIDAVKKNVSGGFFGPKNYSDGKLEIWAQMIMLWVMQDYYEYTGDTEILLLMQKYFNWESRQDDNGFLDTYWENSRGGDNMWSVIWYNNRKSYSKCAELLEKLHNNTADWHQTNNLPNWHGVNFAQGFREPAEYYLLTGDSTMLEAAYNTYNIMHNKYGQMPGGMYAADENARSGYYDPRQGAETCAMVEHMASDEIMLEITGDPFWADHCENVAFNTYPAAFTADMKALRYLVAPNMAISDAQNHNPSIDNSGPFLAMNPFSSRCCQHNHGQGWPYFAQHTFMATYDNGLATMLYAPSEVEAYVADSVKVKLTEETRYPFEGDVTFKFETSEGSVSFPLYFRIPSWAEGATIQINGDKVDAVAVPDEYIRIEREWKDGDEMVLSMPMNVSVTCWTENNNALSVNCGPLTMSLKIDENYVQRDSKDTALGDSQWQDNVDASLWPSYEIFANSDWNYALAVTTQKKLIQWDVVKKEWPADDFPFTIDSVPFEVKTKGKKIDSWGFDGTGLTQTLPNPSSGKGGTEEITLVPMGAARLRISAFPRYFDRSATAAGVEYLQEDSKDGDADFAVFDLQGRKIDNAESIQKGIYIKGGKKFVR